MIIVLSACLSDRISVDGYPFLLCSMYFTQKPLVFFSPPVCWCVDCLDFSCLKADASHFNCDFLTGTPSSSSFCFVVGIFIFFMTTNICSSLTYCLHVVLGKRFLTTATFFNSLMIVTVCFLSVYSYVECCGTGRHIAILTILLFYLFIYFTCCCCCC